MLLTLLLTQGTASNNYTLICQGGSYVVTGQNATVLRSKRIVSSGGSYTITGTNAILNRNRRLTTSGGSYTLSGSPVTILRSKMLVSGSGLYALTGSTATLLKSKLLSASGGAYTYSGQIATITYQPITINNYTLTALGGTYNVIGSATTIKRSRLLVVSGGEYLYDTNGCFDPGCYEPNTYSNTSINIGRKLVAGSGVYSYVGSTITIQHGTLYPDPSSVLYGTIYGPGGIYTGTLVALTPNIKIDLTTGALVKPINDKVVISL